MSAALTAAALLLTGLAAGPAVAHGAPGSPVSRAAACGPEGHQTNRSAACTAAKAAGTATEHWDNVRLPDVAGRDREKVPDGKLCSGGLAKFRGLDLARPDWPVTTLRTGVELTFTYRTTIPHKGTFRWYVTRPGYDPSQPLAWSDLSERPFLTATDPPVVDGSYRMRGKLPTGLSGRHLVYAIWQNSSTPDTYYSCSDVILESAPAAGARAATSRPATTTASSTRPSGGTGEPVTGIGSSDGAPDLADRSTVAVTGGSGNALLSLLLAALLVVALGLPVGLWLRARRARDRRRPGAATH
ncbi:lytic polysaccharide monooxygenase [Micromonospora sp. NPDC050417]|uniref:lytic polysaccharide monooxygenase auxiliary activity family 9 protein n=1 Tax=Micromonospora sp. NPDC050417 TaxID=3364280 RepID=UPI0037A090C6